MKSERWRCEKCVYWWFFHPADAPEDRLGECRRKSPTLERRTIAVDGRDDYGHWPLTCGDDYCGEWQEKIEEPNGE